MEQKKTFLVNAAFYAVIAVLVWAACRYILPALVPFILAFLIASLVRVPVKRLAGGNRKVKKPASILLCIVLYVALSLAVGLVALYLVITIIRNTLEPKIVGKQIGLHPLTTLVAMFLGLKLAGVIGMVAFPVGLTVLMSFKREKEGEKENVKIKDHRNK